MIKKVLTGLVVACVLFWAATNPVTAGHAVRDGITGVGDFIQAVTGQE